MNKERYEEFYELKFAYYSTTTTSINRTEKNII